VKKITAPIKRTVVGSSYQKLIKALRIEDSTQTSPVAVRHTRRLRLGSDRTCRDPVVAFDVVQSVVPPRGPRR